MKNFKTALWASAFSLMSTMAFAQGTAATSGSAGIGANVGNNPSNIKPGADVKTKAGVNAATANPANKKKVETTGNGAMTSGAPPTSK